MSRPQKFPSLQDASAVRSLPGVCIVTGELAGPFKNGGLGTSMTGLAELLAAYGSRVTVLYTGPVEGNREHWRVKYRGAGISLEFLADHAGVPLAGPLANIPWTNAWQIYHLLRGRNYQVIHFNDTMGEGMYCFVAKRLGLAFQDSLLCLAVHSPTEWILELNRHPANWAGFCCFSTGERISMAAADLLWAPSRYMLDWLVDRNYRLPEQVFQQQYVMPTDRLFEGGTGKYEQAAALPSRPNSGKLSEIVFFGRLEERKGLRLFVSAITMLDTLITKRDLSVVFLGKHNMVGSETSREYLQKNTAGWGCNWRIEDRFSQAEAISFLRQSGRLAVIASPIDNSPCTVYECLTYGIPFIAATGGGIPELVNEKDHATHLFDGTAVELAGRLRSAIDRGIPVPESACSPATNRLQWLTFHQQWRDYLPEKPIIKGERSKWAAYIDHDTGDDKLAMTLASLKSVLGGSLVSIIVKRKDIAPIPGTGTDGMHIIDDIHPESPSRIFLRYKRAGANKLICIRSGVRLETGCIPNIEHVLEHMADCVVPSARIDETNSVMPVLAGSAAFAYLEPASHPGAIFVSLTGTATGRAVPMLTTASLHMGLLQSLYALDGLIWPLPETAVRFAAADAEMPARPVYENLHALAGAPRREIYQMLAVAGRYYPGTSPVNAGGAIINRVKTFLIRHPAAIRILFGNQPVKKVINLLYRLSQV